MKRVPPVTAMLAPSAPENLYDSASDSEGAFESLDYQDIDQQTLKRGGHAGLKVTSKKQRQPSQNPSDMLLLEHSLEAFSLEDPQDIRLIHPSDTLICLPPTQASTSAKKNTTKRRKDAVAPIEQADFVLPRPRNFKDEASIQVEFEHTPELATNSEQASKKRSHVTFKQPFEAPTLEPCKQERPKRKKTSFDLFKLYKDIQARDYDNALFMASLDMEQPFIENPGMAISIVLLTIRSEHKELLQKLLLSNALIKAIQTDQNFICVLETCSLKMMQTLLDNKILKTKFNACLVDVLCQAILTEKDIFTNHLLDCTDHTVDLGSKDNQAIRLAVERGKKDIVRKLVLNPNVHNLLAHDNTDLMGLAIRSNLMDIAAMLYDAGANITSLPAYQRNIITELSTEWLLDEVKDFVDCQPIKDSEEDLSGINLPGTNLLWGHTYNHPQTSPAKTRELENPVIKETDEQQSSKQPSSTNIPVRSKDRENRPPNQ